MHDDDFKKGARGEFRGDFTRDTFDPYRHFSRVLMQQGRVQLDSDWNEQVSIFTHYMRSVVADLVGPHGAPAKPDGGKGDGFKIIKDGNTFRIHHGHYYVNGILCENTLKKDELEEGPLYTNQTDYPLLTEEKTLTGGSYLVYLDIWERHLSYVEDDYMREKALGGPDTATRAQIVWQVKLKGLSNGDAGEVFKESYEKFLNKLGEDIKPGSGRLKARARKIPEDNNAPCLTAPEASYRGAENQLYRVEIHKNSAAGGESKPTFKWSRENGSVIFPIAESNKNVITLEHLGRDGRFGLKPNDWVEIVDDDYVLRNSAYPLLQVIEVDNENLQVTLSDAPELTINKNSDKHPYLRRWDQKDGGTNGVLVTECDKDSDWIPLKDSDWIPLEDGVEIQFPESDGNVYQTGDYWLIPARTATGDVEWPRGPVGDPLSRPPQGVEHHYAPLCNITVETDGKVSVPINGDLRRKIKQLWE